MTQHQIVGVWRLVSSTRWTDGKLVDPFAMGEGATGRLIYTADGHVSATIASGGRALLSGGPFNAPETEKAAAFSSFFAYAGRYTLEGDRIVHHLEVASFPNETGKDYVRDIALSGDELTLTTEPQVIGGAPTVSVLSWTRAG